MERRKNPPVARQIVELDDQIAKGNDPLGLLARVRSVAMSQMETMRIIGRRAEDAAPEISPGGPATKSSA